MMRIPCLLIVANARQQRRRTARRRAGSNGLVIAAADDGGANAAIVPIGRRMVPISMLLDYGEFAAASRSAGDGIATAAARAA